MSFWRWLFGVRSVKESLTARKPLTFGEGFAELGIKHFTAREFLTMGGSHSTPGAQGYGLNTAPPRSAWPAIYRLASVLDALRDALGQPVKLHSVYRGAAYNTAVGGVANSQHRLGTAADISSSGASPKEIWQLARELRAEGLFSGGIGIYRTFVHVDIRGQDANWDNR